MECGALYQYLAVICANMCTIAYGSSVGWTSSALLVLESDEAPLEHGPLTLAEISLVGSIIAIGGIIGTLVIGWMSDKLGRKPSLLFAGIPIVISWVLVIYAKNAWYLYIARFLAGFSGGGSFVVIPLFVAEISEDRIRGALGTIIILSENLGILIGFIIGNYFAYETVPKLLLAFPVLFLTCFYVFPESPWFLMKMKKIEAAEKSLRFYRNVRSHCKEERIEDNFQIEFSKLKSSQESIDNETGSNLSLKDFACKPVAICVIIFLLQICCGIFTLVSYAGKIFAQSGADIPPNEAAIIVGAIQLVGTYLSTILVDRVGRKILLSLSFLGTAVSYAILGTYIYLSTVVGMDLEGFKWVPVLSFSSVLFIASVGDSIPFIILGEILPDKIRGIITPPIMCMSWFATFMIIKVFPLIAEQFGLHACVYIFGLCSLAGALYTILCIPETKGRSLQDIEKSFKSN